MNFENSGTPNDLVKMSLVVLMLIYDMFWLPQLESFFNYGGNQYLCVFSVHGKLDWKLYVEQLDYNKIAKLIVNALFEEH